MTHHNGAAVARVQPERDRNPGVRVWRCIAAVLALTQLGAPLVADTMAGDFLESGPTNEAAITPSGYAFGIWAVICVLSVLTTVAVLNFGLGAPWEVDVLADASVVFVGFIAFTDHFHVAAQWEPGELVRGFTTAEAAAGDGRSKTDAESFDVDVAPLGHGEMA